MTSRLANFCRHRASTSAYSPLVSCSTSSSPKPLILITDKLNPSCLIPSTSNNRKHSGGYDSSVGLESTSFKSSSQKRLPIAACFGLAVLAAQKDEEDALVMEVKKAKLNEAREKFTLAEEHYHAALRINDEQRKRGEVDEMTSISHRAWILDAMANMAVAEVKPYKAEKLFKEVIQMLIQMGAPPNSPAVLEISIKLANLFAIMEEKEKRAEAEIGFKYAVDNQKKTVEQLLKFKADGEEVPEQAIKEAQSLLGWALQSYAYFLLDERRKPEALALIDESSDIAKSVYGEESEAFAQMLNDSASAMADKNLFEEASSMLENALVLSKDKGWEIESAFRINLGIISIQRKLFTDAEKHCKAGMELAVKFKSSDALDEATKCLSALKKALTGKEEPGAECAAS